jgi:DNA-binding MarR family transcriptional regulator
MASPADLYDLTLAVRRVFNALKATGDALHADLGVSAAMRAVMESLAGAGPRTVPQIARAKGVTRQHIQVLADHLVEAGLARFQPNAAHRRSDLLALTPQGERLFAQMRRREAGVLSAAAAVFRQADVRAATDLLRALTLHLEQKGSPP